MDLSRILYLRGELEAEEISYGELCEIEDAFKKIPDSELRDDRESAMAADMLEELEARVTTTEKTIYNFVLNHYGESEANDPSWDISLLAQVIDESKEGEDSEVGNNN